MGGGLMSAFKDRYSGLKNSSGRWVLRPPAEYATRRTIVRHIPFRGNTASFGSLQASPSPPPTGILYGRGKLAKWDRAYWADGALTNLITNPSFETNTTGWVLRGTGSLTRVTTTSFDRSYSLLYTYTSGTTGFYFENFTFSPSTTYTFSIRLKKPNGGLLDENSFQCWIDYGISSGVSDFDSVVYEGDGWYTARKTFTSAGSITDSEIGVGSVVDASLHADGAILTATSYEVPYFDGASGTGFSWGGTADGSASSKVAANLLYSGTGLANASLTIAGWFWLTSVAATLYLWDMSSGGNTYAMYTDGSGVVVNLNSSTLRFTTTLNQWTHFAFTKNGATGKTYVNGVEDDSGIMNSLVASTSMRMGHSVAASGHLKGGISDFFIAHTAFSATDLLAIYNSTRPFYSNNARPVDVPFTVKI